MTDTPDPETPIDSYDPDDWIATDHDRVFYHDQTDRFGRGEYELATFVADHIPGWTVLITMGPYRSYDIAYELITEHTLIHLDVYSAGFVVYGPDVSYRQKHPAVEWAETAIHEIAEGIKQSDADFDITDEETDDA